MAYRLEHDESVASGLRRVIAEEIESAGEGLSGGKKTARDAAIHDARKSIKKVRATLRLVREQMGDVWKPENARLRDIAARLSQFRDALAIIQTFDDLKNRYKDEAAGTRLRSIRTGLVKRRRESSQEEDMGIVLNSAAAGLRRISRQVKNWPLAGNGFEIITAGLEKTYRDGRKALEHAHRDPNPENFHELRKRVKDHWYHIRLLEGLWTDVMSAYEKSLKDLEDWLGEDHNLTVLKETVTAEPASYGKPTEIDLMVELIEKYQKELRADAVPLAERIYEEKPGEFSRRMKHLWDSWHAETEHGPSRTAA